MAQKFRSLISVLLAILLISSSLPAQQPPRLRPRIGLALGSGGALGYAHIGVLQWLEEHRIPIDLLTGTSMGALVGGLYATGMDLPSIQQRAAEADFNQIFLLHPKYESLNFRRRQDQAEQPSAFHIGLKHGLRASSGIVNGSALSGLLDGFFIRYGADTNFDDLPIPFRCVATDLNTAGAEVFDHGFLSRAIRASVSIPGVFPPVQDDRGHTLVDGALVDSMPTDLLKQMGAEVIIAVKIPAPDVAPGQIESLLSVLARGFSVAVVQNENRSQKLANVLLAPRTQGFDSSSYNAQDQLIKLGREEAERHKAELLPYQVNETEWQEYLRQRASRSKRDQPVPRFAIAQGGTEGAREEAVAAVKPSLNKPLDPEKVDRQLDRVRSANRFATDFGIVERDQETGMLVTIRDDGEGPPYLRIGMDILAESGDITRVTFGQRLIWQDLGGFGSEFRVISRLGFQTDLSTDYYYRLRRSKFFISPALFLNRDPEFIYSNQERIADRFEQNAGGGVDLGYAVSKRSEVRLGWEGSSLRWHTDTGNDGRPDFSGQVQKVRLRYQYDGKDRAIVPSTSGLNFDAQMGYTFARSLQTEAPHGEIHSVYFQKLKVGTAVLALSGGTSFGHAVSDPLKFTLGGPFRLASATIDEFRADDYALIAPGYLRQVGDLHSALGRVYLYGTYEAGLIHNHSGSSFWRQDVALGSIVETPLGPIGLGAAVGDAGHRKVYFTYGRIF